MKGRSVKVAPLTYTRGCTDLLVRVRKIFVTKQNEAFIVKKAAQLPK